MLQEKANLVVGAGAELDDAGLRTDELCDLSNVLFSVAVG